MRHISLPGYYDSQNRLQQAKLSIDDSDPNRVIAHFRIRGRHEVMSWVLNQDVATKYQAQQINKVNENRPRRRVRTVSRGLITTGR